MATLTHTYVRTHIVKPLANPFLACGTCGKRVEATRDDECGCDESGGPPLLVPCFHRGGYQNLCSSWSPVDGCQCLKYFGRVTHPAELPRAA